MKKRELPPNVIKLSEKIFERKLLECDNVGVTDEQFERVALRLKLTELLEDDVRLSEGDRKTLSKTLAVELMAKRDVITPELVNRAVEKFLREKPQNGKPDE